MLTPSQEKALGLDRHLCVTANAGSGKTRVLVERYIQIVAEGHASVSEVVAITFTEKAASELRRKIADDIVEKTKAAPTTAQRKHLESVRAQLSSAMIGTIHGFCSRILREYPVEANIDAAFSVLEGIDQEFLLQECVHEVFHGILKKGEHPDLKAALFDLLRTKGKSRVIHLLHQLVYKREMMDAFTGQGGIYNLPDEEILRRWEQAIAQRVERVFNDGIFLSDLETITRLAEGKQVNDVRALFDSFKTSSMLLGKAEVFRGMSELMFTQKWELLKAFAGKSIVLLEPANGVQTSIRRISEAAKALTPYVEFLSRDNRNQEHARLLSASRCMLDLYQRVSERYEERKRESGQMDFDDLQLSMKNLLQREPVRERLSRSFKYIMVDEYQDTNLLQYQIILPLLKQLKAGNLFIVGDPKQSIYGFRDADVAVFNRTLTDIVSAGGEEVVLAESFRPLQDIAAFVNSVFSPSMTAPESHGDPYEVQYEELVHSRQNNSPGKVELLLQYKDTGQDADAPLSEADLIARKIFSMVHERAPVFDKQETIRGMHYRDCAILLRSRTKLAEIENALVRHNVPYVVTAGTGYYQTQDVLDFYNYFCFLVNPSNDIALAGILRSPFFSVSDTELFEAAAERSPGTLWEHLRQSASLPDSLQRAVAMLKEDIAVAMRLTVSDLINRIVRQTRYLAILAGLPRRDQCLANLEKLRRFARTFESRGLTNLYDFVERLKRLIEEQEQEGQAAIDVQSDAVQIMTVHAAKGLEFHVVIIPALEREFRNESEPFIDRTLGIGFKLGENDEGESHDIPIVELLKEQANKKSIAEEKRVFYVACTRARDRLILSGTYDPDVRKLSWMQWLSRVIDLDAVMGERSIEKSIRLQTAGSAEGKYSRNSSIHTFRLDNTTTLDTPQEGSSSVLSDGGREEKLNIRIDPVKPGRGGEIFSATRIRTYKQCPARYYLQYVAGLPDMYTAGRSAVDETAERDTPPASEEFGTLLHSLMEDIDSVTREPDGIRRAIHRLLKRQLSADQLDNNTADMLLQTVEAILGSEYWKDVGDGSDTRTEFSITAGLGHDYLTGTIDRIYKDSSGVWNILDYKTDRVSTDELAVRSREYGPQIDFYAFLVAKLFGVNHVRGTLLFTGHVNSPVTKSYNAKEFAAIEKDLISTINSIHGAEFTPPKQPCSACPFLPKGCTFLT